MNAAAPRGLIPPRPNLGPEPWREAAWWIFTLPALWLLLLVLLLTAAGLWYWKRRRRRSAGGTGRDSLSADGQADAQPTPRDRLLALSASIRDALIVPFGTACRAKTTEELAADSRLTHLLGQDDLRELIRFLDQVDRLKFAPERSNHQQEALQEALAAWEPRVETLRARIRSGTVGRGARGEGRAANGSERSLRTTHHAPPTMKSATHHKARAN